MAQPWVHFTSSAMIWRLGFTFTVARGTSSRLRLSCWASVFCASCSTLTFPSNTPRPVEAETMHLQFQAGASQALLVTACVSWPGGMRRCSAALCTLQRRLSSQAISYTAAIAQASAGTYHSQLWGSSQQTLRQPVTWQALLLVQLHSIATGMAQPQLGVHIMQLAVPAEHKAAHDSAGATIVLQHEDPTFQLSFCTCGLGCRRKTKRQLRPCFCAQQTPSRPACDMLA